MRFLCLTREPRLHSIQKFREAGNKLGICLETLDVTKAALSLHRGNPLLHYHGETVDATDYDMVIPRIGTSVTEEGLTVVRQFEAMDVPVLNSSAGILRSRDKLRSLQVLSRVDVDIPGTVVIRRTTDLDAALAAVGGTPCVLKLIQGTQGVGVMLVESRESIESVLQAFWSLGHTILLQEFIAESKGKDVRAFVLGDKVVGAMRREAVLGDFRSNIHRGGLGRAIKLNDEETRAVVDATKAMDLRMGGVDFLESDDGPKVIEVNSSPGFKGLEQATKIDIGLEVMRYCKELV